MRVVRYFPPQHSFRWNSQSHPPEASTDRGVKSLLDRRRFVLIRDRNASHDPPRFHSDPAPRLSRLRPGRLLGSFTSFCGISRLEDRPEFFSRERLVPAEEEARGRPLGYPAHHLG